MTATGNIVRGCRINLNNGSGGLPTGVGILVTAGTGHRFEENTISNCSLGISYTTGTRGVIVRNSFSNMIVTAADPQVGLNGWQQGTVVSTANLDSATSWVNFYVSDP